MYRSKGYAILLTKQATVMILTRADRANIDWLKEVLTGPMKSRGWFEAPIQP